ncbi:MAG: hypothetical protein ACK56F_31855, partial [bacterium]
ALAAADRPQDRNAFAWLDRQADPLQHALAFLSVAEAHLFHGERPGQTLCPGHALSSLWIRGLHWFTFRHYGFVDAAPLACAAM